MMRPPRYFPALCRLGLALNLSALTLFGQTPPFRSRDVALAVSITDDYGRAAPGVKREWFSLSENNAQLTITSFVPMDQPASVVFAFDRSNSVSAKLRTAAADIVNEFIRQSNPENEYLVIGFGKDVKVIDDWSREPQKLNDALGQIVRSKPEAGTAFYDACEAALKKLKSSKSSTRVAVLIGDGLDNQSKLTFRKLRQELIDDSVTLYAIGLPDPKEIAQVLAVEGQGVLDELTLVTGGQAYYPTENNQVRGVLNQIFLHLNDRYLIRFNPLSPTPDNKWHAVKIKLKLPDRDENGRKFPHLNIRARNGYYDR